MEVNFIFKVEYRITEKNFVTEKIYCNVLLVYPCTITFKRFRVFEHAGISKVWASCGSALTVESAEKTPNAHVEKNRREYEEKEDFKFTENNDE